MNHKVQILKLFFIYLWKIYKDNIIMKKILFISTVLILLISFSSCGVFYPYDIHSKCTFTEETFIENDTVYVVKTYVHIHEKYRCIHDEINIRGNGIIMY